MYCRLETLYGKDYRIISLPPLLILGIEDIITKVEIEAYRKDHPHIRVILLTLKDYGSGGSE